MVFSSKFQTFSRGCHLCTYCTLRTLFRFVFVFRLVVTDTVSIDRCSVTRICPRCLYAASCWCFSKSLLSILPFSSDGSLATKTAHNPLQEIFATFGKAYFMLRQVLVSGHKQFELFSTVKRRRRRWVPRLKQHLKNVSCLPILCETSLLQRA